MPAALPAEMRRDIPVLTRLTRSEHAHLRKEAARRGTTVASLQRLALYRTGLLPDATR